MSGTKRWTFGREDFCKAVTVVTFSFSGTLGGAASTLGGDTSAVIGGAGIVAGGVSVSVFGNAGGKGIVCARFSSFTSCNNVFQSF